MNGDCPRGNNVVQLVAGSEQLGRRSRVRTYLNVKFQSHTSTILQAVCDKKTPVIISRIVELAQHLRICCEYT